MDDGGEGFAMRPYRRSDDDARVRRGLDSGRGAALVQPGAAAVVPRAGLADVDPGRRAATVRNRSGFGPGADPNIQSLVDRAEPVRCKLSRDIASCYLFGKKVPLCNIVTEYYGRSADAFHAFGAGRHV